VPLICAILMDKYGYKLSLVVITIFGIIPMYNQANFEKRLVNESLSSRTDSFDTNLGYPWKYTIDERYLDSSKAVGHNREYLPQIYYTYDGKYKLGVFDEKAGGEFSTSLSKNFLKLEIQNDDDE
jgi:hypothetical protein